MGIAIAILVGFIIIIWMICTVIFGAGVVIKEKADDVIDEIKRHDT